MGIEEVEFGEGTGGTRGDVFFVVEKHSKPVKAFNGICVFLISDEIKSRRGEDKETASAF